MIYKTIYFISLVIKHFSTINKFVFLNFNLCNIILISFNGIITYLDVLEDQLDLEDLSGQEDLLHLVYQGHLKVNCI